MCSCIFVTKLRNVVVFPQRKRRHLHPHPGVERSTTLHHDATSVRRAHRQTLHLSARHHAASRTTSANR